jgi:hypothetical protein
VVFPRTQFILRRKKEVALLTSPENTEAAKNKNWLKRIKLKETPKNGQEESNSGHQKLRIRLFLHK